MAGKAKPGASAPAAPKPSRVDKPVSKAVAAPKAEKKKAAPKAPATAKPVPVAVEPAPALAAAPSVETIEAAIEPVTESVTAVETSVEPVLEAAADVVEHAAETVSAPIEAVEPVPPVAPAIAEPAPTVIKKEFVMTVDPKTLFTDFNDRAKAAMEKSAKTAEELTEFAKGNVEALVESSKITAKGLETLGQDAAEYSRKSFETATGALKSMSAIKSPTDFFKLQSDFFRGAFDSYVAEASKTAEAMIKLAGEAAQPISNRVALAAEKVKLAA